MYNLNEISKMCQNLAQQFNVTISCDIFINSRLRTTLGRVVSVGGSPIKIEFSKRLIENYSDNIVREVIIHEMAHYITLITTGVVHGHDSLFKQTVIKMGGTFGQSAVDLSKEEETEINVDKLYKYTVYCNKCGYITGYHKAGKVIKNLDNCICPTCKKEKTLYYKQNW